MKVPDKHLRCTLLRWLILHPAVIFCSLPTGHWWQELRPVQGWDVLAQRRMRDVPHAGHLPVYADVMPAHATVSYTQLCTELAFAVGV
jgi:hypothetical protein